MTIMSQQGMRVKDNTGMLTLLVLQEIRMNAFDTNPSRAAIEDTALCFV